MLIITICVGSSCSIRGSDELAQTFQQCIVDERLEDLCVRACEGYLSLVDFTRRRLHPAVRL